tara:strand:+ start:52 stop:645 length:594 start_codon:yes stop_codon:yes gene_type:complete
MEIIIHRINNLSKLKYIPKNYGVEIDVRNFKNNLILNHDPFKNGEKLDRFLRYYKHGTLIVNIKSEYIESKVLKLLKKYRIKKYFFLDSSYPSIINQYKKKDFKFAIRVSDYESIKNIYNFRNKIKFVWFELFERVYLKDKDINFIKKNKIKVCFVSPELHKKPNDINKVKNFIKKNKLEIDYVCTKQKFIKNWINF